MDRAQLIARPRLVRILISALRHGHALVIAPPGYGKTTLLRSLAASLPNTQLLCLTVAGIGDR